MQSPHESSMGHMGLLGQKVKGQGHNARIAQLGKMTHFWQISLFDHVMDKNHNKTFLRQTVAMVTGYLPYCTFSVLEIHNLCHILL